jgi:hypothetical protein
VFASVEVLPEEKRVSPLRFAPVEMTLLCLVKSVISQTSERQLPFSHEVLQTFQEGTVPTMLHII